MPLTAISCELSKPQASRLCEIERAKPSVRGLVEFTFESSLYDLNIENLSRIVTILRTIAKDDSVIVVSLRPGSIRVLISASQPTCLFFLNMDDTTRDIININLGFAMTATKRVAVASLGYDDPGPKHKILALQDERPISLHERPISLPAENNAETLQAKARWDYRFVALIALIALIAGSVTALIILVLLV
jgi:hypothetical protein